MIPALQSDCQYSAQYNQEKSEKLNSSSWTRMAAKERHDPPQFLSTHPAVRISISSIHLTSKSELNPSQSSNRVKKVEEWYFKPIPGICALTR